MKRKPFKVDDNDEDGDDVIEAGDAGDIFEVPSLVILVLFPEAPNKGPPLFFLNHQPSGHQHREI